MISENCRCSQIFPSLFDQQDKPGPFIGKSGQIDPSRMRGNGQKILIVDDEIMIADSLAEILSDHGYEACAVYDGRAAIHVARDMCPDLVLCDVVMPQLNGVETAIAIRKVCPLARIVLFSGQAGTNDLLKEARANGHSFELLPKPLHPNDLLNRLSIKRS